MRQIALASYLNRISGLIEEQRLPEAAAHCHFILQQHPQHLKTYRLFGRVLLEQQLYDDALDIYKRVLSVDPEDLIAHAGLSVAYNAKLDLPLAIWHMEQAFEIRPYDPAIREELTQLYASRDGYTRQKLELTEPALARLYYRGGLFDLAASEVRRIINNSPERIDLMIVLAKALFWSGKRADSVRVCHELLRSLPYSLVANAIVTHVLQQSGRLEQAHPYLERLNSLTLLSSIEVDNSTIIGQAFAQSNDFELPENVMIEELEDSALVSRDISRETNWSTSESENLDEVPSWLDELTFDEADEFMDERDQSPANSSPVSAEQTDADYDETDDRILAELEQLPYEEPVQASDDLYSPESEFPEMEDEWQEGLLGESTGSLEEAWSWELEDIAAYESTVKDVGIPNDEEFFIDAPVEEQADFPEELVKADTSDELWDEAMDELSNLVSEDNENSEAEQFSIDGWYDEIASERDVTEELPDWLQDSVESTQDYDELVEDDWMDAISNVPIDSLDSESGPPIESEEVFASQPPLLSPDDSEIEQYKSDDSQSSNLVDEIADYLGKNFVESKDQEDYTISEEDEDWLGHAPGDSGIWLSEIGDEGSPDEDEPNNSENSNPFDQLGWDDGKQDVDREDSTDDEY